MIMRQQAGGNRQQGVAGSPAPLRGRVRDGGDARTRRAFLLDGARLAGLGLLATCAPTPPAGPAPARIYRVGLIVPPGRPAEANFWERMDELGYVEGQNLVKEERLLVGDVAELETRSSDLATELVGLSVDVIVAGSEEATRAALAASRTIPIVMLGAIGDPVASGFVESLARPGWNVTGVVTSHPDTELKRLQLLVEVVPGVARIAVLGTPPSDSWDRAAGSLGVDLLSLPVTSREGYEPAFQRARAEGADALLTRPGLVNNINAGLITSLAEQYRLPGTYPTRAYVARGGLMAYVGRLSTMGLQAANYVDRILRGARPADLPVDQPTGYDLIVNLRTARDLGLTLSRDFLARVDEMIE